MTTGRIRIVDRTERVVHGVVFDTEPMHVSTGAGGWFVPRRFTVRYWHGTLDRHVAATAWNMTATVDGQRVRANGTIGTRRGGAVYMIQEGYEDSPPMDTWPTWLISIVRDNHPAARPPTAKGDRFYGTADDFGPDNAVDAETPDAHGRLR